MIEINVDELKDENLMPLEGWKKNAVEKVIGILRECELTAKESVSVLEIAQSAIDRYALLQKL